MRVVSLGLADELIRQLKAYFYDLDLEPAPSIEALLAREEPMALLILKHLAMGEEPLEALASLRARYESVPVLYCLPPGDYDQAGLAGRLIRQLGVKRVLATPVDMPELARSLAVELGLRTRPQTRRSQNARSQTVNALAALWVKFREANLARVNALERAAEVLQHGELEPAARREAEREMHKLVGSAGTFGFQEASALAREAETLLGHAEVLNGEQRLRLLELGQKMREQLEGSRPPGAPGASEGDGGRPQVLAITSNQELISGLQQADFAVTSISTNEEAHALIRGNLPGALLLDTCTGVLASRVQLLKELSWEFPQLPKLVLTDQNGLPSRLALSEMGGVDILAEPYTVTEVQQELKGLLERRGQLGVKVLAVDDDPSILEVVKSTLEPMGLSVEVLSDPTMFWEMLELTSPDLILLDVDMPYLSGLDLCRVLRTDARWNDRPVLFLTSYFDTSTVQRIYQAGADDYVNKPVVDSELVTRISNRLARTQQYRRLADTDLLTGLATRRRGLRDLNRMVQLARRQGLPLAVGILDLDHFKSINDRFGHGSGDLALRLTAQHLTGSFRGEDTVVRWGGEEFVVGLLASNGPNAIRRLEQVLESLRVQDLPDPQGGSFNLTFSGGVAQYPDDANDLETLLRLADQALYRAKEEGRARVYAARAEVPYRRVDMFLVEDDETLAEVVLEACKSRGLSTEWCKDGAEAAALLTADPIQVLPRVVVLDEKLPGLSGTKVLERMVEAKMARRTRVLMMTAQLGDEEIGEALERGAFDYIPKPFALSALMRRIEFALGGR